MPLEWLELRRALSRLRLAQRRDDGRPWTLDDLATKSGVDKATVHRIENTKKYPKYKPELSTLEAIVAACGSRLSDILGRLEEKNKVATENPTVERDTKTLPIPEALDARNSVRSPGGGDDLLRAIDRFDRATAILERERARAAKRRRQTNRRPRR